MTGTAEESPSGTGADPDVVAALRRSRLFGELPERDVEQLAAGSRSVELRPGEVLMAEGDPPDAMYIVRDGELEVSRHAGGVEVLLNVCGPGELIGELGIAHGRPRSATVRARTAVRVQRVGAEALDRLLAHPSSARALLTGTSRRLDREEGLLRQHERMAALGSLAAGLLHELNNPAAAVQRGASRLRDLLTGPADGENPLQRLVGAVPPPEDPLTRADTEQLVAERLAAAGVGSRWETAAVLVRSGVDPSALADALTDLPADRRAPAVHDLVRAAQVRELLEEVATGADYLSRIVSGVRPLAYAADQSPTDLDLHASLEQSLVLLRHKLPAGVRLVREYDPDVGNVQGWAADLAMVWTNLLDNALSAVGSEGTVTVRTRGGGDRVVVEIANTGPTIPPEVLARVFDAFYTTKPIGQGTGLGLATSQAVVTQRHKGRLTLTSQDGLTTARVELPRRR